MNSYQTPKIITFQPVPIPNEKILLYQIQYHMQDIYTDQYKDVLFI